MMKTMIIYSKFYLLCCMHMKNLLLKYRWSPYLPETMMGQIIPFAFPSVDDSTMPVVQYLSSRMKRISLKHPCDKIMFPAWIGISMAKLQREWGGGRRQTLI